MDDESKMIADLIETERKWAAAHLDLDLEMLEAILWDQYRQIQSDGSVIGKEELLASYRSGNRRWETAKSDQYEIRLFGDIALLIGRWRGVGENNGIRFDYTVRFLAVYWFEDGEWNLISDVSIPLED